MQKSRWGKGDGEERERCPGAESLQLPWLGGKARPKDAFRQRHPRFAGGVGGSLGSSPPNSFLPHLCSPFCRALTRDHEFSGWGGREGAPHVLSLPFLCRGEGTRVLARTIPFPPFRPAAWKLPNPFLSFMPSCSPQQPSRQPSAHRPQKGPF